MEKHSFTCRCGEVDHEPAAKFHPLGRAITCKVCGAVNVMVHWRELPQVEPGKGRPRMSKKERRIFRKFVEEHADSDLIKELTR